MVQALHFRELLPVVTIMPGKSDERRIAPREKRNSSRKEKIARLREQIRQGTYHVSAADIARAILLSATSQGYRKKKDD